MTVMECKCMRSIMICNVKIGKSLCCAAIKYFALQQIISQILPKTIEKRT